MAVFLLVLVCCVLGRPTETTEPNSRDVFDLTPQEWYGGRRWGGVGGYLGLTRYDPYRRYYSGSRGYQWG